MHESLDLEQKLEKALDTLAARETDFETACKDFADAESTYRIKLAKAFLEADGSMELRKHTAIVQVETELRERDKCEAVKEFTKEKLRDVQAAVSARQSILSASVRTNKAVQY